MTQIKYNFGSIAGSMESIDSFLGAMDATISDLEGIIQPIVAASMGQAIGAYNSAQTEWRDAAGNIHEILGLVRRAVSQGAENMDITDKEWAKAFE